MGTKEIKGLVESSEKEFQAKKDEQLKEAVKEIVQHTLEKIDELDKEIKDREESKKILKLDLEDLRNGKLDLIEERQKKDSKAAKVSLVIIKEVIRDTYYPQPIWIRPYDITWNPNTIWCGSGGNSLNAFSSTTQSTTLSNGGTFTCSVVKDNASGCYNIGTKVINFR